MTIGNWRLTVCGINHKSASVSEREPLLIMQDDIAGANAQLMENDNILEALVLSTCNRIESYLVTTTEISPIDLIGDFYKKYKKIDIDSIKDKFYTFNNKQTANHLFRVTSGLDSMVLGENQIVGQAREAYSSACKLKSAGKIIHRLFHQAFRIGKRVRTETEMGRGACSVSSAAIELLKTRLIDFDKPSILFVGINQMISLAASGLAKLDYDNFIFANRTKDKATEFAQKYNVDGHSLENLDNLLSESDVCISCTGSEKPLITQKMIAAHPESFGKPLLILDMAVPRDTNIETDFDKGVEVLDLDAVQEFVKDQQERRRRAIPNAEVIIEEKLKEFTYWFNHVRHEPLYTGLESVFEAIRQKELADAIKDLTDEQKVKIELATKSMINKLLQVKTRPNLRTFKSE